MQNQDFTLKNISAHIGQELGVSEWLTIDQDRIDAFADATGDHQWIHVDQQRAAASPLGGTIAHGYLVLSLLPGLSADLGLWLADASAIINYGADRVRFTHFVPAGSRIRVRARLMAATPRNNGVLLKFENTVEIEGVAQPAMIAETLALALPS